MTYPQREFFKEEEIPCKKDRGGCGRAYLPLDEAEIADLKRLNLTDTDIALIKDKMSNSNCPSCAVKTLFDLTIIYDRHRVDNFANLSVRFCSKPECRCQYELQPEWELPILADCGLSAEKRKAVFDAHVEDRQCLNCVLETVAPAEIYTYLQERADGTREHAEAVAASDARQRSKAREERLQKRAEAHKHASDARQRKLKSESEELLRDLQLSEIKSEKDREDRQRQQALAEIEAELKGERVEQRRIEAAETRQKEKSDRDRKHQKRLRDARDAIRKSHQKQRIDPEVLSRLY